MGGGREQSPDEPGGAAACGFQSLLNSNLAISCLITKREPGLSFWGTGELQPRVWGHVRSFLLFPLLPQYFLLDFLVHYVFYDSPDPKNLEPAWGVRSPTTVSHGGAGLRFLAAVPQPSSSQCSC